VILKAAYSAKYKHAVICKNPIGEKLERNSGGSFGRIPIPAEIVSRKEKRTEK